MARRLVAPAILYEEVDQYWLEYLQSFVCTSCGMGQGEIEERYSFGVYAGRLCRKCCYRYRDHCGIDQDEGRPEDYEGQYWED